MKKKKEVERRKERRNQKNKGNKKGEEERKQMKSNIDAISMYFIIIEGEIGLER